MCSVSMVSEVEVILEADEEKAEAKNGHFDKRDPGGADFMKDPGMPSLKDDENQVQDYNYIGGNIKDEPELEKNEAASVPHPQRRRPRIQFGLTPRQVKELEIAFEKNPYPNAIKRKDLARRLFLTESRVQ
ncbi:paired box protein Pax-3-A-like, partial [Nannospalax galili]|uniref:paired box protein Pax-3-A-like n=1 Tax=Nannospalax galili TaxID=1026970 RepID=UPI00111C6EC8